MTTVEHRPPEGTATRPVTREDAIKFLAKGHTSASLSALAAEAAAPPDFLLELSAAVAGIEADGLTPAACRGLLAWTPEFTERVLAEALVPVAEIDARHPTLVTRPVAVPFPRTATDDAPSAA